MKPASIFVLTLLAAVPALAQNDLSWVSQRTGIDTTNPCTITSPCKTFSGAYAKTNSGGIIKALDAGEYGEIVISKPITIDGNGVGAAIDVTGSSTAGVTVNTPGFVEIRSLAIHVAAGCVNCYGIYVQSNNVSVEDVSITGVPLWGVGVIGGATATIHGLTVTGANTGIFVLDATATISDSIIRYSTIGIQLTGAFAATQTLIERSKMISNTTGLQLSNEGVAPTARISDCVITGNTTGVSTVNGGQIISFRNNTWAANITDGTTPFSLSLK
jgi:Right handed beta helix region